MTILDDDLDDWPAPPTSGCLRTTLVVVMFYLICLMVVLAAWRYSG